MNLKQLSGNESNSADLVYLKGRKRLRKKILRFLRYLPKSAKVSSAKSPQSVNRKSFSAKYSKIGEPQKFFSAKFTIFCSFFIY